MRNSRYFFIALFSIIIACWTADLEALEAESVAITREYLRKEFREAQKGKKNTKALLKLIETRLPADSEEYPAIVLSYYGATKGLEAKFSFNPAQKVSGLSLALKLLDKAVDKDPDDLEVRFVRFATLSHLPPFFGVGEKRLQDVNALYLSLVRKDYARVDLKTQLEMIEFLLRNGKLTKQQRSSLGNLRKELLEK
ncbi:MAG TPA: hypothetical protein PL155_01350 [Candidatus Omnitrophota bacterium]|nr:hypothetical protein [Candidatus Omnitrophota bacterium]HPD84867.1 hypothetical protein [Candidatus Omnitrophota bacterium]HRZ03725.1 hypothetical protein [Candidatus Omnitrophota bacterium]